MKQPNKLKTNKTYALLAVSLSSDGTIVAIGAFKNDGNGTDSGHVRVYQYNASSWTQMGQDIDGEAAADYSGSSVSLSSDGTIVGIGANTNCSRLIRRISTKTRRQTMNFLYHNAFVATTTNAAISTTTTTTSHTHIYICVCVKIV